MKELVNEMDVYLKGCDFRRPNKRIGNVVTWSKQVKEVVAGFRTSS